MLQYHSNLIFIAGYLDLGVKRKSTKFLLDVKMEGCRVSRPLCNDFLASSVRDDDSQ